MNTLERLFRESLSQPSDINEHVAALYRYSSACRHITEFGTRAGTSTAAFLYGRPEVLVSYDVHRHPQVEVLEQAAQEAGVAFEFHQQNVLETSIAPTDLLFVDTLHTYEQMRAELARHGNSARKYLIFHDTETFREQGEVPGSRGIWPAIAEFMRENPWWRLAAHYGSNNGLTVLTRYQVDAHDHEGPPEPYRSITILPFNAHGWFREPNFRALSRIVRENQVRVAVELGSWLGASALCIARMLPEAGKLYAVDTWLGSTEHHEVPEYAAHLPTLYQQFLSNVVHAALTRRIVPVRMTVAEAAGALAVTPDLVYVDASHDEESVLADIRAWHAKLAPGGILCGDDWQHAPVQCAVTQAAGELGFAVEGEESFWWSQA